MAPCVDSCPAGISVQGYIALISRGKFKEAYELIKNKCPLPGVIGRICPHPCEIQCNRKEIDESISICTLKRASFDYNFDEDVKNQNIEKRSEKVAIIGSGPSGLTVAYNLLKKGYQVTIFEELPVVGGMLSVGIPEYRLPRNVIKKEIDAIKKMGVRIKLNTKIGKDFTIKELFKKGFKAIFIGVGAHKSRRLGIKGEDFLGVYTGVDFLRNINLKNNIKIGKKVAIIGGGDVAIDSARTALRMGCEPYILYRRTRDEMPSRDYEIKEAEIEGISIQYLVMPTKILGKNGKVIGLECVKMKLGRKDKSGRKRPIPIKNSEFVVKADAVISAIGQYSDLSFISGDIESSKYNTIIIDENTCSTSVEGIFAGGDCVSGPSIAINAIASGNIASDSIDRYLKGENFKIDSEIKEKKIVNFDEIDTSEVEVNKRLEQDILSLENRKNNFKEVERGFTKEQAIEEAKRCLNCGICSECNECIKVCERECINPDENDEIVELEVGSIILSPGMENFNPKIKKEYGYKRFDNVITSIEFERLLSATGPFEGEVLRPSDKRSPKSIAFIQCIGSRDDTLDNNFCSAICCTYATKEAIIAKEHIKGVETHIFYMDMRTYGKGFQEYYDKAVQEYKVKYTRCRVSHVEEIYPTKNLKIIFETEDGIYQKNEFDMVVLSVGLKPGEKILEMSKKFGIEVNKYGYCETNILSPLETTREGIFVAGTFQSPKDIPDSVAQAGGASVKAGALILEERGKLIKKKEYPIEKDICSEPRIGVFICHCGINIVGVVDVKSVVEYSKNLPDVVYIEDNLYTCSQDTQEIIKQKIVEHNLNRVVVASCTPTTHEPIFQSTIREAGLNPYLFNLASLREHCSWVHRNDPEKATEKAKQIVALSVEKVRQNKEIRKTPVKITPNCLVIGGGVAGMTAALDIANQGFEVHLLEKESKLGGNLNRIQYLLTDDNPKVFLKDIIEKIKNNKNIKVYKNSKILDFKGFIGNFKLNFKYGKEKMELDIGTVVVALGGEEYKPNEYSYRKDDRIITQLELEKIITDGDFSANKIVMIQCVGSRNEERQYCSRLCCAEAIKNALRIKEINQKADIFILHKDIRTYGFREEFYNKAREKGVFFLKYEDRKDIDVKILENKINVRVNDKILKRKLEIKPDMLILSGATIPTIENERIAKLLRIPLNQHKFFLEAHMKISPVDFPTAGIFLCGNAHSPKFLDETIAQASAAAGRVCTVLSKETAEVEGIPVLIDDESCTGCGICEENCPHDAIRVNKTIGKAEITEILCKGCGLCSNVCPSGVPYLRQFESKQLFSMIEVLT